MGKRDILLLVGRDDWQKDECLNWMLLNQFAHHHFKVVWEDAAAHVIYRLRWLKTNVAWLPPLPKKFSLRVVQLFYGLFHPRYFVYLFN